MNRCYERFAPAGALRAGMLRAMKHRTNLKIMNQNTDNINKCLLEVDGLKTYFPVKKGLLRRTVGSIKAVNGVSFSINAGESLGLVGESGCGKTTVARTVARLIPATAGQVTFEGQDVLSLGKKELRKLRKDVSIIFQDPYSSLNPRMTVGTIVGEPLKVQEGVRGSELADRIASVLDKVGLSADYVNRYPHEFSGGQRQRIGIARALILAPKLVICDEPVSALDVSIQSQILNLLKDLQDEFGLTYLFIAHDLAVVEFFCKDVAVMYLGRIVESAPADELYKNPLHPYTKALMQAIPQVDPKRRKERVAPFGEMPSVMNPPKGCAFHPRCPLADGSCAEKMPELSQKDGNKQHFVACWKAIS